jgi:adenylyl cyclase-associated protein
MPDPAGLQAMLAPVAAEMVGAASLTEGRRTPAFNVLKMVAEAMQALSWLAYTGPTCGGWEHG